MALIFIVIYVRTKNVQKQNKRLEYRVGIRTKEVAEQKDKIENMNHELMNSYSQLKSNVQYAKQIQQALLPSIAALSKSFENNFVFYKSKGIVSGDFYWVTEIEEVTVLATIDCTGHGVSGAFMTVLTNGILRDIVDHKHIIEPDLILKQLQLDVASVLNQQDTGNSDGMDISIITYNKGSKILKVASAITSVLIFKGNDRILIKGDKVRIGGDMAIEETKFTQHRFKIDEVFNIYMFSDGFYDQFGGSRDLKYSKSRFFDFLEKNKEKAMFAQESLLEQEFNNWKGEFPQIDDVLVLGIKFE